MESKPAPTDPTARVGPFFVVRQLVACPGANFVEACADDGTQVLLQTVRCLPRPGRADPARLEMLRNLSDETASLGKAGMRIVDHGRVEEDDLTTIYWALPWDERAVELGLAKIDGDDELVSVAIHLARRLCLLHQDGRLDPLLSERTLVIESAEPRVVGVPIRVDEQWLAPDMRPARLAPEETLTKQPTKAGDVWRLGQALKALTVTLDRLPTRIWKALELISHPDITIRVRTAEEALSMVENLADPHAPDPPSVSDKIRAESIHDTMTDEENPALDDMATIADEPISKVLGLPEASTEPSQVPILPPDEATLIDRSKDELTDTAPSDPAALVVPVVSPEVESSVIPQMRKKRVWPDEAASPGPTGTRVDASLRAIARPLAPRPIEVEDTPPPAPPPAPSKALVRTNTTPGDQVPVLMGPQGTLVGQSQVPPSAIQRLRPVDPAPVPEPPPEALEETEEALESQTIPSPKTAAVAFLTFILGLIVGVGGSRLLEELDGGGQQMLRAAPTIYPDNVVHLEAEPRSAVFVSERDGKILGPGPLSVGLLPKKPTALLVAAEGHRPMRITLPDRGRLTVKLEPFSDDPGWCSINVHVPDGITTESVGTKAERGSTGYRVPRAAVIRSTGPKRGAWLIRCPADGSDGVEALPGRIIPDEVEVRFSQPLDVEIYLGGALAGTAPLRKRIPAGFVRTGLVNAKGHRQERWLALFQNLDVELPEPSPPPAPEPEPEPVEPPQEP